MKTILTEFTCQSHRLSLYKFRQFSSNPTRGNLGINSNSNHDKLLSVVHKDNKFDIKQAKVSTSKRKLKLEHGHIVAARFCLGAVTIENNSEFADCCSYYINYKIYEYEEYRYTIPYSFEIVCNDSKEDATIKTLKYGREYYYKP